jgi:hypothetical protein
MVPRQTATRKTYLPADRDQPFGRQCPIFGCRADCLLPRQILWHRQRGHGRWRRRSGRCAGTPGRRTKLAAQWIMARRRWRQDLIALDRIRLSPQETVRSRFNVVAVRRFARHRNSAVGVPCGDGNQFQVRNSAARNIYCECDSNQSVLHQSGSFHRVSRTWRADCIPQRAIAARGVPSLRQGAQAHRMAQQRPRRRSPRTREAVRFGAHSAQQRNWKLWDVNVSLLMRPRCAHPLGTHAGCRFPKTSTPAVIVDFPRG